PGESDSGPDAGPASAAEPGHGPGHGKSGAGCIGLGGAWGRWRPFALTLSIALVVPQLIGTFGASRNQPGREDIDALAIIIVVIGPLSLYAIARHTRPVLWFVAGITAVYLVRGYPYGPVFISLVLAVV